MMRALFMLVFALLASSLAAAQPANLLPPGKRIVFLGDSNTFAGHYIVLLDAALRLQNQQADLINLGLPSETASGLSEPDHPFPRPTVHERLDRALAKTRPDVVFACYGTNDGIYYPFSEERFAAYKEGIGKLIEKVHATGAKLVLLTPPPFDPLPLKPRGKLLTAGAAKYSWINIYEKYDDEVLARYAEWIMQQRERVDLCIDIRKPMLDFIKQQRIENPNFTMANDGIHFNEAGHRLIAEALLKACAVPAKLESRGEVLKLTAQRQFLLRDAWLSQVGHKRPGVRAGLPLEEAQQKARELDRQITDLK